MALAEGHIIQVIDTHTGEVLTQTSNPNAGVYMGRKRKHPGGFVIVYENEFREAQITLKKEGLIPICLFNILCTQVTIGSGDIFVNTIELAKMISTSRTRVSTTLKRLVELGLLAQVGKEGRHFIYRINPSVMWKGRETERQDLLKVIDGGKKEKIKRSKNV